MMMTKNAYTLLFITAFSVIYLAAFVARRHGRYWYAQPSITDKAAASSDHHQQQKVPKSNGKPATSSDDNVSWLLRNLEDSFFPPPNSSTSIPDCFCPESRPNWIYYSDCPGSGAGMKDRQNIMRNVLWWADELCARVAVKCSPKVFLGEKHSCFAPETATWDEYFVTGRGPPSRATGKRTLVDDVLVYEPLLDDGSKFENLTTIVTNLRSDLEYPNREDADNEGMMTGIDGYKKARELASRNETFVWRFEVSFWNSNLYTQKFLKQPREQVLSHRDYTDNCPKIDFYPTRHHLHFARIVLDFLNITKVDQYATMHLRRGDYRKCNTEPDEVIRYLNCSLGDVIASPQKRLSTLLIFTNGDSGYKHNLTKNLEEHFSSSLRCIVVDDLIKTDALLAKLDDEASDGEGLPQNMPSRLADDNCYSWQALKVIISLSKIHLERGHMSCQTCDVGGVDPTKTVV